MKITKYEHSCIVIEESGQSLIIDPGAWSPSFTSPDNTVAVFVSHVHQDHFDTEKLALIKQANPQVKFFAPEEVANQAKDIAIEAVSAGKESRVGNFKLNFFGGQHELFKQFQNIAVLVNDTYYHPGDSYTVPESHIKVLGLPAAAPWLRITDAVEFLKACRPDTTIPIHTAVLSELGEGLHFRILGEAADEIGSDWQPLKPGESIEV